MGVDIYGINPTLKSEKPQLDWDNASEKNKHAYIKYLDEWREENPGNYFRSNWWGWRPLVHLCEYADAKFDLDIDFTNWGSNDGAGLKDQLECNRLADALENICSKVFDEDECENIQLCLGMWCTEDGGILSSKETEPLNKEYPYGSILSSGIVLPDGKLVYSAHMTTKENVQDFIAFLKECGGFEIW